MSYPAVLDLFAGAGGLSLGFEQAGFHAHTAIECDAWAANTLRRNHTQTHVVQKDIAQITDEEVRTLSSAVRYVGVIGGPPCQGFSHSNIVKRDPRDPRNSLFQHFARFVNLIRPDFFLSRMFPAYFVLA